MKKPEQGESFVQRHEPLLQRLLFEPQTRPQLPQLLMSLARFRHVPLQHDCPEAQVVPQPPQWVVLVRVSTHAPSQQL